MGVFFGDVKQILQIEHNTFKSQKSKLDAHQLAITNTKWVELGYTKKNNNNNSS